MMLTRKEPMPPPFSLWALSAIDVHAVAGAEQIGEQKTHDQRDRGHHLEIDQRLDADAADLLEIAGTGNAVHDDAEHDRRHDHRDQFQERVAEDLEPDGELGCRHPEHNAEQQRRQHLDEKRGVKRLSRVRRDRCCGDGRHNVLPIGPGQVRSNLATCMPKKHAICVGKYPARTRIEHRRRAARCSQHCIISTVSLRHRARRTACRRHREAENRRSPRRRAGRGRCVRSAATQIRAAPGP